LHEFGHALGLMHEHLHPQSGLHFIDENVVADMTARHWCDGLAPAECSAKVRAQITRPALGDHACRGAEKYDSKSIMHYPIEKTWTLERREVPLNTHLSDGDVACVRNLYLSPAPPLPPPETPKPKPPISHGCPPPIWACCGCCGRCVSVRNQCTISRPRLPPRWVRGFWTEWWDDEW
jgi:hypothetical protein